MIAPATDVRTGYVDAGAATLRYESRGRGPGLLFVPGGLADSAHFAQVADLLRDAFTVVTYDRRGNGGSPRPAHWHSTTMGEQADDAAALIEALALGPCAVWGGSLGGVVLLELLARRPGLLRAAIVQEPPLFSVLPDGDRMAGQLARAAAAAVRGGRTGAAVAEHARAALGGAYDRLAEPLRARMAANADVFFGIEVPGLLRSLPAAAALERQLARVDIPVACVTGAEGDTSPPQRATRWLADRLGTAPVRTPGGHLPSATEPSATAATIRQLLAT